MNILLFWTKCYKLDQLRKIKIKAFILPLCIPSMFFLTLCEYEFLTYFSSPQKSSYSFLEGTFNVGRKFPQFLFDWESISPSLFKDNHRILDWWDFFPPNTFNSSLHCPFVYSFWEVGLYAYLFSFIGQLFFSPTSFRTFLSLCFSSCLKRYA